MANRKIRVKIGKKFVDTDLKSRYSLHYLGNNRLRKRMFYGESESETAKTLEVSRNQLNQILRGAKNA